MMKGKSIMRKSLMSEGGHASECITNKLGKGKAVKMGKVGRRPSQLPAGPRKKRRLCRRFF